MRKMVCFLLALAPLGSAMAQKPAVLAKDLPKDLPRYGTLKPFQNPAVRVEKLANGLELWLVARPGFPKVSFVLGVRGGLTSDPAETPGLSEVLAAAITQGTATRGAKQIAEQIADAGGDLSARAEADDLIVTTQVPSWKAADAVTLIADVAQNAKCDAEQVEAAKRTTASSLRGREAQPAFLITRALAEVIFANNPYSHVAPTAEAITRIDAPSVRKEYIRRFRPDQAVLVVVGDFEPATMLAGAKKLFSDWSAPQEPPIASVPSPRAEPKPEIFFVSRPASVQTTIALASVGPIERDANYSTFQVANFILASRLSANIREQKGYAYGAGSLLQTWKGAGLFQSRANVRNAVTGAALKEFQLELAHMAGTSVTEEELTRAQRYLLGTSALLLRSQRGFADRLLTFWIDGLPFDQLQRESASILKVTRDGVEAVSREYFPPERQTIVAVGDEKVIREQMSQFGKTIQPVH